MVSRQGWCLFALVCLSSIAGAADAAYVIEPVVFDTDPAPDGNGRFEGFDSITINSAGDVAFNGLLAETAGGFNDDDSGIFLVRAADGIVRQVARHAGVAPDGNGYFGSFFGKLDLRLNENGVVGFETHFESSFGGTADNLGICSGDGSEDGTTILVRKPFVYPRVTGFNNEGEVTYLVSGPAIERTSNGVAVLLADDDQALPNDEGTFSFGVDSGDDPAFNDLGQVVFRASVYKASDNPKSHRGIYRADGENILQVARTGTPSPDGNGLLASFSNPAINDNGDVAFLASLTATSGGAMDDQGVFLFRNGELVTIARRGEQAPDGNGKILNFGTALTGSTFGTDNIALNEEGQVAFLASFTGASGGAVLGMIRGDESSLTQVVRIGQLAPDGVSKFTIDGGYWLGMPALNDRGQVAFYAALSEGEVFETAIFLYDDEEGLIQIARKGDALFGSTLSEDFFLKDFQPSVTTHGKTARGLSDEGHVVFHFGLATGAYGIAVARPATDGICGNDVVEGNEECDDGDVAYSPGDRCRDDCLRVPCGQPRSPYRDGPLASDALFVLGVAVGSATCDAGVCDVRLPAGVAASDALLILKKAVGSSETFSCPA
jgi:hypothetical protein